MSSNDSGKPIKKPIKKIIKKIIKETLTKEKKSIPKIALAFSGHLRDFSKCIDNIKKNLISELEKKYEVHYFFASWQNIGHRSNGFSNKKSESKDTLAMKSFNPKAVVIQEFNREIFLSMYNTNTWTMNKHLSGPTTCPDACSMYYLMNKVFHLVEEYQSLHGFVYSAVVRIRPDILYNEPISHTTPKDKIIMPRWHGRYIEISNTITDYFAMGNFKNMKVYMTLFKNLDELLALNVPHCGEYLLYSHLLKNKIEVERFDNGFSVQRKEHIELVVEKKESDYPKESVISPFHFGTQKTWT